MASVAQFIVKSQIRLETQTMQLNDPDLSVDQPAQAGRRDRSIRDLPADTAGTIAIIFAVCLPVLIGVTGLAIDFGNILSARQQLQQAADAGALTGAKELSLSDAKRENVPSVVKSVVDAYVRVDTGQANRTSVETTMADSPLQVMVTLRQDVRLHFGGLFNVSSVSVEANSIARVMGSPNICMLALETSTADALKLEDKSFVEGKGCSIFSDSRSAKGLSVRGKAAMSADSICSAGGVDVSGDISPAPYIDCPQFDDPLASRAEPTATGCDFQRFSVKNKSGTISPGVYCGGLKISGQSDIKALPGVYVIRGGDLAIADHATLRGSNVSFYLAVDAKLKVDEHTSIMLEARKEGALAGILIFASRSQPLNTEHQILSREAQQLVGTLYFPKTTLIVGSEYGLGANVGSAAAYTAIVARRILVRNKSAVVLNTDYDMTDVPVPDGIRGAGQPISLVK
jgi:Flp pilus assembly protein TadG